MSFLTALSPAHRAGFLSWSARFHDGGDSGKKLVSFDSVTVQKEPPVLGERQDERPGVVGMRRRCSASGVRTSTPDVIIGVTTMTMMRSTSMTSARGDGDLVLQRGGNQGAPPIVNRPWRRRRLVSPFDAERTASAPPCNARSRQLLDTYAESTTRCGRCRASDELIRPAYFPHAPR